MRRHTKKHPCLRAGCSKEFSAREDLNRHLKTLGHGGKREFRCPDCTRIFTRIDNLKRHQRCVHTGTK